MKRSITYLAAAVVAVASCSKELPEPIQNDEPQGVTVTLTATMADATKATVANPANPGSGTAETLATTWDSGDEIAVFTKLGNLVTLSTTESGTSATFTGTLAAGDELENGAIAYYPASIAVDGNPGQVILPSSYASTAAARKGIALKGTLSGDNISFSHIGALLVFQVKEIPTAATTATFSAKGCTGTFDASGGTITKGTDDATVTITLSDVTKSSTMLAIPLPTGTYDGFSLSFNDGDSVAKTTTKSVTLVQAQYKLMKSFTVSGKASAIGVVGQFQGWDPATRVLMTEVPGESGWLVARGISISGGTGGDDGFKFCSSDTWTGSFGAGGGAQELYAFVSTGSENVQVSDSGIYDIYLNPDATDGRILIMEAGAPVVKTIYVLPEYVPGTDLGSNPNLHIWCGNGDVTNWSDGTFIYKSGNTTINGTTFHAFPVSILKNHLKNGGKGYIRFWKGYSDYKLQYRKVYQSDQLFELKSGTSVGDMEMGTMQAEVFVRAGKYAALIDSYASADNIPSIIHISGTMNGWPAAAMGIRGVWVNNGILWKDVSLTAGENKWKFREYPDWEHQNICVSNNEVVTLDEELQLIRGGSQNLVVNVPEAGNYDFFLDMTTLKVLVTKAE